MSFLRFYDGAVPGKKRKTEETNGARKNKIKLLNMPKKNKLKSTFWKNLVLFNLIKQRKVQLYEMVLVTSFKLHYFCVLSVVSLMVFKNERQSINSYRWNLYRI